MLQLSAYGRVNSHPTLSPTDRPPPLVAHPPRTAPLHSRWPTPTAACRWLRCHLHLRGRVVDQPLTARSTKALRSSSMSRAAAWQRAHTSTSNTSSVSGPPARLSRRQVWREITVSSGFRLGALRCARTDLNSSASATANAFLVPAAVLVARAAGQDGPPVR